jgi:hypothetical protein
MGFAPLNPYNELNIEPFEEGSSFVRVIEFGMKDHGIICIHSGAEIHKYEIVVIEPFAHGIKRIGEHGLIDKNIDALHAALPLLRAALTLESRRGG